MPKAVSLMQLLCPETLAESELLEILKSRCIELPNANTLKKSNLVEMFKRVALPLPQRQYNEAKCFGRRLSELRQSRKISIAIEEDKKLFETRLSSQNKSDKEPSDCKRLNTSSEAENKTPSPTKEELTNSSTGTNGVSENHLKRKVNNTEVSAQSRNTKRQKITWP